MHLTRFTDIGLRVLMYLTVEDREEAVTVGEIAQQFALPRSHVVKVAHRLGQLGWVGTQRGRAGGLRLAVASDSLRIGDVLRTLEGPSGLVNCTEPLCGLHGRCRLKGALDKALRGFYEELNALTLADVSINRTGQAILQMHQGFIAGHGLTPLVTRQ